MTSLLIIVAQIILKEYKEIRWGMILCSLSILCIFICLVVNICLLNWDIAVLLLTLLLLSLLLENQFLPILWKSKKLIKDERSKS